MGRKIGHRALRTKYVVLGDGLTEQYYLTHLKEIRGYGYSLRPHFFSSITIETAELIIDELLSGGCDCIVYITDYDTIVGQNQHRKYLQFISKYRKNHEVLICESMPSIEFWFLLHYIKTTRNFRNADEAVKELKKHIPDFSKEKTFLENQKWVEDLCRDEKLSVAIKNASEILAEKREGNVGAYFPFSKIGFGVELFENKMRKEGSI
jgi:hypothetical protein